MYRYTLIAVYSSRFIHAFAWLHVLIYRFLYSGTFVITYVPSYCGNSIPMRGSAVVNFQLHICVTTYMVLHRFTQAFTFIFACLTVYVFA